MLLSSGWYRTLLVLAALPAVGQNSAVDIAGTWQGMLAGGPRERRTVYKISRTDSGAFQAVFYSLDQGGRPVGASSVSVQGSTVKIVMEAIGGAYEGKLSADGNTLSGAWKSSGKSYNLTLTRATEATAWAIPEPRPRLTPMAADVSPEFEVATVKPTDPNNMRQSFSINGRHFSAHRNTLHGMIMFAYGVHPRQITGLPGWADSAFFDIEGQPDQPGEPSLDQWKVMLQKLLAERFQLTLHREKKELAVYTLGLGKNGPRLTRTEGASNDIPDQSMRGRGLMVERNASMNNFAFMLQASVLDRPVVDETGLKGRFDFTLRWTPDEFHSAGKSKAAETPDAPPDLFTAIQEQLGLKLESTKAPADVLVVDKVEKPSEN